MAYVVVVVVFRKMLQNAYFLAKIGVDTAENKRNFAENLPTLCNYPTGPRPPKAPSSAGSPRPTPRPAAQLSPQSHVFCKFSLQRRSTSLLSEDDTCKRALHTCISFELTISCTMVHRCSPRYAAGQDSR